MLSSEVHCKQHRFQAATFCPLQGPGFPDCNPANYDAAPFIPVGPPPLDAQDSLDTQRLLYGNFGGDGDRLLMAERAH